MVGFYTGLLTSKSFESMIYRLERCGDWLGAQVGACLIGIFFCLWPVGAGAKCKIFVFVYPRVHPKLQCPQQETFNIPLADILATIPEPAVEMTFHIWQNRKQYVILLWR